MADPVIPDTMDACVLVGPQRLEIQRREVPGLQADEVLVRVESVGICGSDIHYFSNGRIGNFVVDGPLVLGHEVAGEIVQVGERGLRHRLGERVAIEPQRPCLRCRRCCAGRYNLCPHMKFMATPPVDGALSEFVAVPSMFSHAVPDSMSFDEAALLEPVSVCIAACRKAGLSVGQSIHIAGAGPIGLMMVQVARAFGATTVIVSDPHPTRRDLALSYGADEAVPPLGVGELSTRYDVFIDASGNTDAILAGIGSVVPGGVAIIVGLGEDVVPIPLLYLASNEITLTGIFRYVDTWPSAINLVRNGRVSVQELITQRVPLNEVAPALNRHRRDGHLKTVITPSKQKTSCAKEYVGTVT